MKRLSVLISIILLMSSTAIARQIEGVNFEENLKISGENFVLNGVGVRSKVFVKAYACGLYMKSKTSDAKSIINADKPMAIRIVVLSSLVTNKKMQKAMTEGLKKSTNNNILPLKNEVNALNKCLKDEIVKKDEYTLAYIPGKGVEVKKNGVQRGIVPGLEFKKALFGIWLSESPIQESLKEAMLNKK